ncbi:hypothetical protein EJK80_02435 [Corynebacterium phoceense]|uniref:Uncharacterized protein n=1 Tax=Corynebacterium phoceense TaxID=1686286 RepID=A0A540R9M9_9CORY|nr:MULTISPECIES: hypothetical protein [Corynebacterium]OFL77031.1 hypothetical protein HMPREF2748_05625 [Corynebacterium sp. HMSC077B05]TQE44455.1 hypothetical protein EJK80_02435 [Corynebacterium phoceense]
MPHSDKEPYLLIYGHMDKKHDELTYKLEELAAARAAAEPYLQAIRERHSEARNLEEELLRMAAEVPIEERRAFYPETAGHQTFVDTLGRPVINGEVVTRFS